MLARHLHLYFSAFSVAKAGVFLSHIVTEAHMEWWTRIFFLADVKWSKEWADPWLTRWDFYTKQPKSCSCPEHSPSVAVWLCTHVRGCSPPPNEEHCSSSSSAILLVPYVTLRIPCHHMFSISKSNYLHNIPGNDGSLGLCNGFHSGVCFRNTEGHWSMNRSLTLLSCLVWTLVYE